MKYKQLVVNGCSYMHKYAAGLGHVNLKTQLGIDFAQSITVSGSANSRILRTTLKHSYQTDKPTFYVIGLSFVCRWEVSISESLNELEGRWVNVGAMSEFRPQFNWTKQDSESFTELNFKGATFGMKDLWDDLIFRLLSMLGDLRSRGHQALIYNQIDAPESFLNDSQIKLLGQDPSFVHALHWRALPWQRSQGVPAVKTDTSPEESKHLKFGYHDHLNTFLTDYITQHNILR
jgi:hypothetical protein